MEKKRQSTENTESVQVHVPPDLEYVYRDIFNVFVGTGDVVIEFGNLHRSTPEHATLSNRIVLSVPNAYNLVQTMQKALQDAQVKLQHSMQAQQGKSDKNL